MNAPTTTARRKLKICVVGSTYPRHHEDHEVPWLRKSVNLIAARGHDVTVVAPSFEGLGHHTIDGVRVLRFRYAPKRWENLTHDQGAPNKLHNPLYNLLAPSYIAMGILRVALWHVRERFDVIHVHWPFPHGLFAVIPALMGAKVVATCHGAELALARRKTWIRRVLAWCLRRADVLGCNSSHTAAEIKAVCGRAASIVPYGATIRAEPPRVREKAPPGKPATILFSGRLIQRKGLPYLIRAIPEILQRRPIKLLIVGDGDRRSELETLTRKLTLEGTIQFLGFVSNERLGELYRACDLYVHPAIFDDKGDTEGLGVVLIEALLNARPIVASAVGGIVDVIEHEETGLLVPEKNEGALAAAILRLLGDPALARRLGEAGRQFAERHFDWSRITADTEALYDRALAPRHSEAQRNPRSTRVRAAKAVLAAVVGIGIIGALRTHWSAFAHTAALVDVRWIGAALVLSIAYRLANACGWPLVLGALHFRLPVAIGARIWLVSETMRWLPGGGVWGICSRVHHAKKAGVPAATAAMSLPLELLLTIAAWTLTAVAGLGCSGVWVDWFSRLSVARLLAVAGFAVAVPAFALMLARRFPASRLAKKACGFAGDLCAVRASGPRVPMLLYTFALYLFLCAANGLAFYAVVRSFTQSAPSIPAMIGINAAGWLIGFFALWAPGGLGAREAGMTALLLPLLPLETVIGSVLAWRLVQVGAEAACLAAYLLTKGGANSAQPHLAGGAHCNFSNSRSC